MSENRGIQKPSKPQKTRWTRIKDDLRTSYLQTVENEPNVTNFELEDTSRIPTLYDSARGAVLLKAGTNIEKATVKPHKLMSRGFNLVDHKYTPKIRPGHENEHVQPRNVQARQFIAGDDLLTLYFGHEPEELNILERDQVKVSTGVDLPDSDLMMLLKERIEQRIKRKFQKAGLEPDVQNFVMDKMLDSSAVLALTKFTEGLIKDKVTLDVIHENVEEIKVSTDTETDAGKYLPVKLPFQLKQAELGSEFRHGPFVDNERILTKTKILSDWLGKQISKKNLEQSLKERRKLEHMRNAQLAEERTVMTDSDSD